MQIGILGATSLIARDLILSFGGEHQLFLFARNPDRVSLWLQSRECNHAFTVDDFSGFKNHQYDVIINFVGVGNPAKLLLLGSKILGITHNFDQMVLDYIKLYPSCRYIFLSSGAAYGSRFLEPVNELSTASVPINNFAKSDWYGVAKLHAECRHRALADSSIYDIRVFNYFSRNQDTSARFLITDIVRAIRDKQILATSSENIFRDFLHPADFYQLINLILEAPEQNTAIDCYSLAPIDKMTLLEALNKQFGLQYEVSEVPVSPNATGTKPHYYSRNKKAAEFGYEPTWNSLDCLVQEISEILKM